MYSTIQRVKDELGRSRTEPLSIPDEKINETLKNLSFGLNLRLGIDVDLTGSLADKAAAIVTMQAANTCRAFMNLRIQGGGDQESPLLYSQSYIESLIVALEGQVTGKTGVETTDCISIGRQVTDWTQN